MFRIRQISCTKQAWQFIRHFQKNFTATSSGFISENIILVSESTWFAEMGSVEGQTAVNCFLFIKTCTGIPDSPGVRGRWLISSCYLSNWIALWHLYLEEGHDWWSANELQMNNSCLETTAVPAHRTQELPRQRISQFSLLWTRKMIVTSAFSRFKHQKRFKCKREKASSPEEITSE